MIIYYIYKQCLKKTLKIVNRYDRKGFEVESWPTSQSVGLIDCTEKIARKVEKKT